MGSNPKEETNPKKKNKRINYWRRPPRGFYKLNVDGSVKPSSECQIGCIIRNEYGQVVDIFHQKVNTGSILQTEALAFCLGIKQVIARDIKYLIVEWDNLGVTNALNGKSIIPWEIMRTIKGIVAIKSYFNVIIFQHYYRGQLCNLLYY